jgi:streptogramin lyase
VGCGSGVSTSPKTAPAPVASFSTTSIRFGSQTVGAGAVSQTITVSNTGNAALSFSGISLTGTPFALAGTCSTSAAVGAGSSCTIIVSYAPTAAGSASGSITVATNAAGSPQTIALSGSAYAAGASFNVSVMAGTLPVSGATLQLYAAGTSGNGSAGMSLLINALTTSASGTVAVPGHSNCPSTTTQVYLVSRGGTVGTAVSANSNLVLMTALGACSALTPGTSVVLNEETTVAAVAALAPFYSAGGLVGASATNTTGLANAFSTAAELANPVTGQTPGLTLPANAIAPTARLNALANAINGCAVTASSCGALFAAATVGSTTPANTLDAIYNVLRNPANNVAGVYAASMAGKAFSPSLSAAPADWTMFFTLRGGGMNGPSGLGVDSAGNVWVASYFGVATKFNALGAAIFPSGITGSGLNNSYGLAMDLNDDAWIPNEQPYTGAGTGSVSELSPGGASLAGPGGFTAGGMNYPISVAIDPNGTVWVVDYGNSHLTLLNAAGAPLSGTSGYTTSQFSFPVAVVVDGNHFGWVANQSGATITKAAPDGSSFTSYSCCHGASGLAIDQADNVWVANYYGDSVSLLSNNGMVLSNGAYTGLGGIDHPQGIAIDGAGNAWVANFRQPYLTELAGVNGGSGVPVGSSLTPATGYGADAKLLEAYAIAVDASGSLWVSNFGSNTLTRFIGLATPVKTPLSGVPQLP